MDEQSLALAFGSSLTEEVSDIAGEYAELGLDALVEDGLFKDIPIVSTAVAVYRIGKSIREKHHIAKLISFLNEINKGIVDEEKRQNYREKFTSNEKFRNQELEYILILIDRYISFDKPQLLAKLYLAYLDGLIDWSEFLRYSEILDRFLHGDIDTFLNLNLCFTLQLPISDSILRLSALGLFSEEDQEVHVPNYPGAITIPQKTEISYRLTQFGYVMQEILQR